MGWISVAFAVLATVQISGLNESSGIVASRKRPGIYWTHNDEGAPYLFALDRAGKSRGRVRITRAINDDWEDIAMGPGNRIYIGDIGDNTFKRKQIVVYRVEEPEIGATRSKPAQILPLKYPDGAHDAEALLVHPQSGDLYIITKAKAMDTATRVYKVDARMLSSRPTTLKHIADINLPEESVFSLLVGRITGGDIAPDGRRVILCDYFRAWEAELPAGSAGFDAIWKQKWRAVDMDKRQQGEGICYRSDGKTVLATSEGERFPLIEVELRR